MVLNFFLEEILINFVQVLSGFSIILCPSSNWIFHAISLQKPKTNFLENDFLEKNPNQIIVLRPINYIRCTLKNKKPNQTNFFHNAQTLNILNLVQVHISIL